MVDSSDELWLMIVVVAVDYGSGFKMAASWLIHYRLMIQDARWPSSFFFIANDHKHYESMLINNMVDCV